MPATLPASSAGAATEARRRHWHARERQRAVQLGLQRVGLVTAAEAVQAFVIAVQAPDVVRVLAGPSQRAVEPEVGAVHRRRLLDMALLEQQRAERMAGRLHPAP